MWSQTSGSSSIWKLLINASSWAPQQTESEPLSMWPSNLCLNKTSKRLYRLTQLLPASVSPSVIGINVLKMILFGAMSWIIFLHQVQIFPIQRQYNAPGWARFCFFFLHTTPHSLTHVIGKSNLLEVRESFKNIPLVAGWFLAPA